MNAPTQQRPRARTFSAPCVGCQVGQGRMCQCEGAARVCNGKRQRPRARFEMPVWAWQVLIYGASFALVVGTGWALWRAW